MSHYPDPTPCPGNAHLEHAIKAASQYDEGYRGMAIEILALRAKVREFEAHSCDTCDNQQVDEGNPKHPWCGLLTKLSGGDPIYCYDVDQGCGAWKAKALKQNVSQ